MPEKFKGREDDYKGTGDTTNIPNIPKIPKVEVSLKDDKSLSVTEKLRLVREGKLTVTPKTDYVPSKRAESYLNRDLKQLATFGGSSKAEEKTLPLENKDKVIIDPTVLDESVRAQGIMDALDMINKAGSPDDHTTRLKRPSYAGTQYRVDTRPSFAVAGNSEMPDSKGVTAKPSRGLSEVEESGEKRLVYLVNEIRNRYADLKIKINEDGSIPKGFFSRNIKNVEVSRQTKAGLDEMLKEIDGLRNNLGYNRGQGSKDKWSRAYEEVKDEDFVSVETFNKQTDIEQQNKVLEQGEKLGYTVTDHKIMDRLSKPKSANEWSKEYKTVKSMSDNDVTLDNEITNSSMDASVDKKIKQAGFSEISIDKKSIKKGFFARLFGAK